MAKFGLKLGLGESSLAAVAEKLWRRGGFDFLELYIPTQARVDDTENWRWYDGVLVLHAPHSVGGFNFAKPEMEDGNRRAWNLVEAVRHELRPELAVFHPGLDGSADEALRQISLLAGECPDLLRVMILENKPRIGMNGEDCLGAFPEDMRGLLAASGCGFCLDIRHAFAAAAWAGRDWRGILDGFAALSPRLWHAADGWTADRADSHLHIGDGDMPWRELAAYWRHNDMVTIECAKNSSGELDDFLADTAALRDLTESAGK